jgi:hypothetical protein
VQVLRCRSRQRGQTPPSGVGAADTRYVDWTQWAARWFGVAGGIDRGPLCGRRRAVAFSLTPRRDPPVAAPLATILPIRGCRFLDFCSPIRHSDLNACSAAPKAGHTANWSVRPRTRPTRRRSRRIHPLNASGCDIASDKPAESRSRFCTPRPSRRPRTPRGGVGVARGAAARGCRGPAAAPAEALFTLAEDNFVRSSTWCRISKGGRVLWHRDSYRGWVPSR